MPTLNIGGRRVKVDDSFLSMPPDQQQAAVEEIAKSLPQTQRAPKPDGTDAIAAKADAIEKAQGTSTFTDATNAVAGGIPFSDELYSALTALPNAAVSAVQGKGFHPVDEYNQSQALQAELTRRRNERSPIASTVGSVAGGMAATGPLAKAGYSFLNGAKATLPSLMGRGAAEGAAYGAVYGAGEGEGLNDRAKNAAFGAAFGLGTGAATGALARVGASKTPEPISLDQLRAAKSAAYDAADELGIQYKPEAYRDLAIDIVNDARAKKLNPARHPKAASLIADMAKEVKAGTAPTLRQLDEFRQIIYRDIGRDEAEQYFGNRIIDKIDDFIDNARVGEALTGDPSAAGAAVKQARELNRRYRNAQTIEEALIKAERRAASSNSGGNLENTTRQNLRRILDNKSTSRFLNDAEKQALETVVRGTKGQNAARSIGNWSKGFGGHSIAGGAIATSLLTGNPLPLAGAAVPYMAGSGLKAISRGIGNSSERAAEALIRTGKTPVAQLDPLRRALIEALTRGSAQQPPAYTSQ